MLVSRTVHALFITKCNGNALSQVSPVRRRHGLWRVLKDEYEENGGHRLAALLRGIFNPRATWEICTVSYVTLATCMHPGRETLPSTELVAGADLQQAVQVATVVELSVIS